MSDEEKKLVDDLNTRQSDMWAILRDKNWMCDLTPPLLALFVSLSVFSKCKWFDTQESSSFSCLFNYTLVLSNFFTVNLSVILMNIFSNIKGRNANLTVEYNQAEKQVIELLKS